MLTGSQPYRSTSASVPSSWSRACMEGGRAHKSRNSHQRVEFGMAYHPPIPPGSSASCPHTNWYVPTMKLTCGTASLTLALAASVVTVLFTSADFEKTLQRKGAARPVLNARENMVVYGELRKGEWENVSGACLSSGARARCWTVEMATSLLWTSAPSIFHDTWLFI